MLVTVGFARLILVPWSSMKCNKQLYHLSWELSRRYNVFYILNLYESIIRKFWRYPSGNSSRNWLVIQFPCYQLDNLSTASHWYESLKIPKTETESVNRKMTDDIMINRKRTKSMVHKTLHDWETRIPLKPGGWTQVLRKSCSSWQG